MLRYKEMCDRVILENGGTMFILECYKNQKMCNNVIDDYPHAFEFLPDYFQTQKMCNKAVDTYHAAMQFVPECYKTQESC